MHERIVLGKKFNLLPQLETKCQMERLVFHQLCLSTSPPVPFHGGKPNMQSWKSPQMNNFLWMDSYVPIMPTTDVDKSSGFLKDAIDFKCSFLFDGCFFFF